MTSVRLVFDIKLMFWSQYEPSPALFFFLFFFFPRTIPVLFARCCPFTRYYTQYCLVLKLLAEQQTIFYNYSALVMQKCPTLACSTFLNVRICFFSVLYHCKLKVPCRLFLQTKLCLQFLTKLCILQV